MRTLLLAAITVPGLVLLQAQPASATWSCTGAEYVCGKPSAAAKTRHSYSPAVKKKTAVRHHQAKQKSAYRSHKARSYKSAARYEQRSRRAARPSSRQYSYESYSGGGSDRQSSGIASYYWQGQRVASGGRFNPNGMTAAHRTLPFGTKVRVTHARTGRSVIVTINDRGPFIKGRVIDLSRGAASAIGMIGSGVASVQLSVVH